MRLFRYVAATALLLPVATHVHASDISPSDTIIVTATRTEIPLEQATVPVRVITWVWIMRMRRGGPKN